MLRPVPSEEIYRKILHGLVVILPVSVYYIPVLIGWERVFIVQVCALLFLISVSIEFLRLRNLSFGKWFYSTFGSMMREDEKKYFSGATYVAGAIFLCACLSTINEAFAAASFLGLTLFILGDAVAALAGKLVGRIRIGQKTLEGTIACFLLCLGLGYFFFPYLPQFTENWGRNISLAQASLIAFSVAVLELFPIKIGRLKINDNLYVPVFVSIIAFMVRDL
jgi:dolichol kinase